MNITETDLAAHAQIVKYAALKIELRYVLWSLATNYHSEVTVQRIRQN